MKRTKEEKRIEKEATKKGIYYKKPKLQELIRREKDKAIKEQLQKLQEKKEKIYARQQAKIIAKEIPSEREYRRQIITKRVERVPKKVFTGIKQAYGYRPKLSNSLLNIGAGYVQTSPQQVRRVQANPGRPVGDYKHRSPFTGKPIPAVQFYKEIKTFRRLQEQRANQQDLQAVRQLAKRGIPPQQAQQIIDQRQLQSAGAQSEAVRQNMALEQMRQQQNVPQQVPQMPQQIQQQTSLPRPIWRRYNAQRYERDIFGNVKVVNGGNDPRNFWN